MMTRLFRYRLQLFELAKRTSVAEACRTFGVHRSSFSRWKRRVERHGPGAAAPARAAPAEDANALPAVGIASEARWGRGAAVRRAARLVGFPSASAGNR